MAKSNFNAFDMLNMKSRKTAEKERAAVEEKKGTFDIEMLDVYDLLPSDRNFYSTNEIKELALSIELLGGIEQNLVVKPPVHGKFEVIAGHRRRLASIYLVEEGKEKYRYVPCRVKDEKKEIIDRLKLILTNSTTREMNDWEKIQQYKELKAVLEEYRKQLEEDMKQAKEGGKWLCEFCSHCDEIAPDNYQCTKTDISVTDLEAFFTNQEPGCPHYDKIRFGRTRDMIAEMLHLSGTQLSRYEKIDNSLNDEFKQELAAGNINVSTAHEIARKPEKEQERLHEEYEQTGELHIKDVREETQPEPQEIPEEQINNIKAVVKDIMIDDVNRDVFGNQNPAAVVKTLKRFFYQSYKGGKAEAEGGEQVIYRFSTDGVTIMSKDWSGYLVSYESLADIILIMIAAEEILLEPEAVQQEIFNPNPMPTEEESEESQEEETGEDEQIPGQDNIMNHPEYLPDIEPGLTFSEWIEKKSGRGQQDVISEIVKTQFLEVKTSSFDELMQNITAVVNDWLSVQSGEYSDYLKG